ncbi:MAG: GTP-binding protein HflX [Francisellaceae bacterium]
MQLFEGKEGGDRCLLISIEFSGKKELNADIQELHGLVSAAKLFPIQKLQFKRKLPDAKLFLGKGKAQEAQDIIKDNDINVVVFNHPITPSQERNLELQLDCKIIDRTGIILEIFADRAKTREGKLQVELARLSYQSTRLVKGWSHLERQKGGIGVRGGPGEKQLELDKRMLRERIISIQLSLEKVKKQRRLGRSSRKKANIPTIAFVGYTNAGKSTLFNTICGSDVFVKDQLFATLDPTLRKVNIPKFGPVVFSDTVGFIKNLPHKLVEAFSATLEETIEADLLIHVIDYSDENYPEYSKQVYSVLKQIHSDQKPIIEVYNKIDLMENTQAHVLLNEPEGTDSIWLSAVQNTGIDILFESIAHHFHKNWCYGKLIIPTTKSKIRSELYDLGVIKSESTSEDGEYILELNIARSDLLRIIQDNNLEMNKSFSENDNNN